MEVQGCRRRWSSGRCLHKHQRRHCAAWNVEQRAACILMLNLAFSSWQHRTVDLWSRPASGHCEPLHEKRFGSCLLASHLWASVSDIACKSRREDGADGQCCRRRKFAAQTSCDRLQLQSEEINFSQECLQAWPPRAGGEDG